MKVYTSQLLDLSIETGNSFVEDLLQDKLNLSSTYKNVFVISQPCFFKMLSSTFLILTKRDCLQQTESGSSGGFFISKTLFATGLANFKSDKLKTFKESLLRLSRSSLLHSIIEEEKKIPEKVPLGFGIGNMIDLTASNRIKLHPVCG